jgi:hypothetical protein
MGVHRSSLLAGALAGLLGLAGCSGPEVRYDFDAKADFAGYHSFDWAPAPPRGAPGRSGVFDNPIMAGRVTRALEAGLAAKGFRRDAGGAPDLLVDCYPVHSATRVNRPHLGLGMGLGPLGVGVAAPVGSGHRESIGSIVMEVQDARTRVVVWRGTAQDVLRDSDSPEESDAAVADGVKALLKRFPPSPKG